MTSKIIIQGMHFKAHHGYYLEERKIGGQYIIDIEMEYDIRQAAEHDNLEDTINYEKIYQLCKSEMTFSRKLIETAALNLIEKIQEKFPGVQHMIVTIHKINPPIDGLVDRASVKIEVWISIGTLRFGHWDATLLDIGYDLPSETGVFRVGEVTNTLLL